MKEFFSWKGPLVMVHMTVFFLTEGAVWEGFVSIIFVRAEKFYCRGVKQQIFPPFFVTILYGSSLIPINAIIQMVEV